MHIRVLRGVLLLGLLLGLAPTLAAPRALAQISADVRDRVIPAVIEVAIMVDVNEDGVESSQYITVGSGTVLSADGAILTNWHVVDMAAHRAELDRWGAEAEEDGQSLRFDLIDDEVLILRTEGISEPSPAFRAKVIAEQHALDFAALQITSDADGYPVDAADLALPFVPLGDSADLRQGDPLHVFGYPAIGGGTLQYTTGVVSGFGFDPGSVGAVWITTDASVSGGSSGGAAVNAAGELVGVPTQGGPLDCRPGDTDGDGDITADDVGCIPTGGSIGQLRPIDLARPMLADAGVTLAALPDATQQETLAATVAPSPTAKPQPTSTPSPTPTPQPQPTPTPSGETADAAASSDVPMYRGNAQRTGEMPGPAPEGELGVLWEVDLGYGMYGQPALVDGVLYVAAGIEFEEGGIVAAFDALTGKELWRKVREETWSSPLVIDGRLYYTDLVGRMMALRTNDGVLVDTRIIDDNGFRCPSGSSPVPANAMIIASFGCFGLEDTGETTAWGDLDGVLIAFTAETLVERWRFPYEGFTPFVSPTVADGTLFIADVQGDFLTGSVYAVDAETGQERWRFSADGGFVSTPLVAENIIIAVSSKGVVYALDVPTGLERWRFEMAPVSGLGPALGRDAVYVGDGSGRIHMIALDSGEASAYFRGEATYSEIASDGDQIFIGGQCGYLVSIGVQDSERTYTKAVSSCSQLTSPIVAAGVVVVGSEDGKLAVLGDVRANVTIADGLKVFIVDEPATIRAAPSSVAVVRGEAAAGTAGQVTGPSEEREGETWWPVDVEGIGSGWVQESALMAAEVPLMPTPTARPTATPESTATPEPTSVPTATPVATGPDRDISVENLPLLDLLPSQDQVPYGLILANEGERSKQAVAEALGGSEKSLALLNDWGWSGSVYRDFALPEDADSDQFGATFINVSVHRFADAESAAMALVYFASFTTKQGIRGTVPPMLGGTNRLMTGAPGGVPLTVFYVQEGPLLFRIGGSAQTVDAVPTADVIAVARAILEDK